MKKMTRYHVLTAVVVVALMIVSGSLIASNMGFKLVDTKTFNPASRNLFGISVPHNSSYTKSEDFLTDQFDGSNDLTLIVYDSAAGAYKQQTIYSGTYGTGFAGLSIPLVVGDSFDLNITASLTTTIVGSQDPNYTHSGLTFNPASRNLFGVALTPNTKWTKSEDVLTAWFDGSNDLTLIVYDSAAGLYKQQTIYSGTYGTGFAGLSIPLSPGVGFNLNPTADLPGQPQEPYY
jgi:hypothetical protein